YLAGRYLGLPERTIFYGLAAVIAAYLVLFRRVILRTGPWMLLLSLAFLGLAVSADIFIQPWLALGDERYLLEDGAKWLGIVAWSSFHVGASRRFLAAKSG